MSTKRNGYATAEQLREMIQSMVNYETTQKDIAKEFGVSQAYLSDFLAGNRGAGPKILRALGYDAEPFYRLTR